MLLVGIIRRPHGLSGAVSVEAVTGFPERFVAGTKLTWRREEAARELEVVSARRNAGRVLLCFAGVDGLDAARALAGGELLVAEEEAFPAPPGFYYSHEIEGFRCEDPAGRPLGVVEGLSQTAAGPLLTLETTGGREALVPFVDEFVRQIDRDARKIVLKVPEGLLDL